MFFLLQSWADAQRVKVNKLMRPIRCSVKMQRASVRCAMDHPSKATMCSGQMLITTRETEWQLPEETVEYFSTFLYKNNWESFGFRFCSPCLLRDWKKWYENAEPGPTETIRSTSLQVTPKPGEDTKLSHTYFLERTWILAFDIGETIKIIVTLMKYENSTEFGNKAANVGDDEEVVRRSAEDDLSSRPCDPSLLRPPRTTRSLLVWALRPPPQPSPGVAVSWALGRSLQPFPPGSLALAWTPPGQAVMGSSKGPSAASTSLNSGSSSVRLTFVPFPGKTGQFIKGS